MASPFDSTVPSAGTAMAAESPPLASDGRAYPQRADERLIRRRRRRERDGDPTPPPPDPDSDSDSSGAWTGSIEATEANARHLLGRAGFGATPQAIAEVTAVGIEPWIDSQLAGPDSDLAIADADAMSTVLAGFATLDADTRTNFEYDQAEPLVTSFTEIQVATLLYALESRLQLREVMVDFWSNHFNTNDMDRIVRAGTAEKVAFIRTHALGSFRDLLRLSTISPAMLRYLDNESNRTPDPNENFARELLELHTVSVDGPYDEHDVKEAARVFTGWSIRDREFFIRSQEHDTGPASVMDWSTPGAAGDDILAQGNDLLDHLARHPSTARHLASKLVTRLVADDPPSSLVDRAARVYLDHDTAIAPVVRTILLSREFWQSRDAKLRRPFELLTAALRTCDAHPAIDPSTGTGVEAATLLLDLLTAMGQPLYTYVHPTGYPDEASAWLGSQSLLTRWQTATEVAGSPHLAVDTAALSGGAVRGDDIVFNLGATVLGRRLTRDEIRAVGRFVGTRDELPEDQVERVRREVLGLLLSSPAYQWR